MKAASQLLTKKILRVRLNSGKAARARSRNGWVSAACSTALKGPSAASIQLSARPGSLKKRSKEASFASALRTAAAAAKALRRGRATGDPASSGETGDGFRPVL